MRAAMAMAAAVALGAATGCVTYEPLAGTYGLVPSETQRIAIVHAQAFWEAGTLQQVPAGKIHWVDKPGAILEFLGAMEGRKAQEGLRGPINENGKRAKEGGQRALAILFFPADAFSRRTIELDEHLDILAGYVQHGTTVARPAYFTSPRFKRAVIDAIGWCMVCRDYLGIHPAGRDGAGPDNSP